MDFEIETNIKDLLPLIEEIHIFFNMTYYDKVFTQRDFLLESNNNKTVLKLKSRLKNHNFLEGEKVLILKEMHMKIKD